MQLVVTGGAPESYFFKVLFGVVMLTVSDGLWLLLMYENVYKEGIMAGRGKEVCGVGIVLYALLSSSIAATVTAESISDAASVGALLGVLVFAVFNITTYAMNSKWKLRAVLVDTAYGTAVWAAMVSIQHISASVVSVCGMHANYTCAFSAAATALSYTAK